MGFDLNIGSMATTFINDKLSNFTDNLKSFGLSGLIGTAADNLLAPTMPNTTTSTGTDDYRFDDDRTYAANDEITIIDKDWITSRFMASNDELDSLDATNRFYSSSQLKFTDTRLGGNIGINSRPQYTRYCDIRNGNRNVTKEVNVTSRTGAHGMGRYYSEAIDDNAQTIFMEFGIPKFNSLLDYFTKAISYEDAKIANTGRLPVGYTIGQIIGGGVMLAAFPLITITIWALKLVSKLVLGTNSFNYYYLEPAMHMYWGAVNSIVTSLATEMGILIPELMNDGTVADRIGTSVKINQDDLNAFKSILPDLITDNNFIDVFAIATRAQTVANQQLLKEREVYLKSPTDAFDFNGYVKDANSLTESKSPGAGFISGLNSALSFNKFLTAMTSSDGLFGNKSGEVASEVENDGGEVPEALKKNSDGTYNVKDTAEKSSYLDKLTSAIDSSIKDGGMHAVFYVDYVGSINESFSNSIGDINSAGMLKSAASTVRSLKFDMAGGNIAGGIDKVLSAGKDVLAGALDSVTFGLSSVISTMMGDAYVDMPKKWDDSDMSMPSITYNMQLISPYGNVISQLQNIYIPLAMLLAGALPLSTGKSSYTSPFICSLFNKGMQKINMGMITSLSISRGTSNLGFNKQKRPLAIDVSFTVTDFSTRMTAPVNSSIFNVFNVALEDDTPLGNYLSVLGSRDLLTSKYMVPKIKLRASRLLMAKEQMLSPAAWGLRIGDGLSGILGGAVADHSITLSNQN